MSELAQTDSARPRRLLIWYGLATALAIFGYFYGLDSDHIPRNGDELPYAQITRLTAATGHWLPGVADISRLLQHLSLWSTVPHRFAAGFLAICAAFCDALLATCDI